jgi:hypothetical protein
MIFIFVNPVREKIKIHHAAVINFGLEYHEVYLIFLTKKNN